MSEPPQYRPGGWDSGLSLSLFCGGLAVFAGRLKLPMVA